MSETRGDWATRPCSASALQQVRELLQTALERIEPPGAWTQYGYATDANGERVEAFDDRAVSWCVTGALSRARFDHAREGKPLDAFAHGTARCFLARATGLGELYQGLAQWNDAPGRTHEEVRSAFRRAVAAAGGAS